MTSNQPESREFDAEGLLFREQSLARRFAGAIPSFIRHKPLGAFGIFLILFWLVFAVGTLGDGGGWLRIGRYDSLTVFKEASLDFADSRVASVLDGVSASADTAELLALFDDAEYLGALAAQYGVAEELHAYVLRSIEQGEYPDRLLNVLSPLLELDGGILRFVENRFATGTEAPLRTASLKGPSAQHWFGTDRAGQDIYARIAKGARLSLTVGIFAAAIATSAGLIIGLSSGYLRGRFDLFVQRLMDAMQAFPPLIFLLLLASVTRQSLTMTVLALGILGIADNTRIVRGNVMAARESQYVEAAHAIGAGGVRVATRHILPNIIAPLIVIYTISIGAYILAEATLSFLGLGPIQVSWGKMVSDGRQFIISGGAPWLSLWSGLAITTLVFGFNVAGDALRDTLDPRLRGA